MAEPELRGVCRDARGFGLYRRHARNDRAKQRAVEGSDRCPALEGAERCAGDTDGGPRNTDGCARDANRRTRYPDGQCA